MSGKKNAPGGQARGEGSITTTEAGKIMTDSTTTTDTSNREPAPVPSHLADLDQGMPLPEYVAEAQRRARAFPCGVPGCDRSSHTWSEDPTEWLHYLEKTHAGRLEADVFAASDADDTPRQVRATVLLVIEDELTDENAVRALAAELRSYATIIERQVVALELHSAALTRSQR